MRYDASQSFFGISMTNRIVVRPSGLNQLKKRLLPATKPKIQNSLVSRLWPCSIL
jgi:hypothetical protein